MSLRKKSLEKLYSSLFDRLCTESSRDAHNWFSETKDRFPKVNEKQIAMTAMEVYSQNLYEKMLKEMTEGSYDNERLLDAYNLHKIKLNKTREKNIKNDTDGMFIACLIEKENGYSEVLDSKTHKTYPIEIYETTTA